MNNFFWSIVGVVCVCGGCSCCDEDLIFSCNFNSEGEIVSPNVGPKGECKKLDLCDGHDGKALRVPVGGKVLSYDFHPGFIKQKGTIEFWAKIDNARETFQCCDPCFYHIRFDSGEESTIQFTANNGLAKGGLYGRLVHHERITENYCSSSMPYNKILANDAHGWHHYAFLWDVDGIKGYAKFDGTPSCALMLLDGNVLSDVPFMAHGDPAKVLIDHVAKHSVLAFPLNRGSSRSSYVIDDFKIWSTTKVELLKK